MNNIIKERVTAILEKLPESRDNDRELIVRYWKWELYDLQKSANQRLQNPPHFTVDSFFASFMTGGFTNPDSITRARRQVQEQNPHLRGKKYRERQARQEDVKKELGYR